MDLFIVIPLAGGFRLLAPTARWRWLLAALGAGAAFVLFLAWRGYLLDGDETSDQVGLAGLVVLFGWRWLAWAGGLVLGAIARGAIGTRQGSKRFGR